MEERAVFRVCPSLPPLCLCHLNDFSSVQYVAVRHSLLGLCVCVCVVNQNVKGVVMLTLGSGISRLLPSLVVCERVCV